MKKKKNINCYYHVKRIYISKSYHQSLGLYIVKSFRDIMPSDQINIYKKLTLYLGASVRKFFDYSVIWYSIKRIEISLLRN